MQVGWALRALFTDTFLTISCDPLGRSMTRILLVREEVLNVDHDVHGFQADSVRAILIRIDWQLPDFEQIDARMVS